MIYSEYINYMHIIILRPSLLYDYKRLVVYIFIEKKYKEN